MKKLFIVDVGIFEEVFGVLIEFFFTDFIPHFQNLPVQHCLALRAQQLFDETGGGREEALVDGTLLFLHAIN